MHLELLLMGFRWIFYICGDDAITAKGIKEIPSISS
jgi:hypothetical protein